jgi:hypothetical protein
MVSDKKLPMRGSAADKQKAFIHNSRLLHGDRYDYSKVVFVNVHEDVIIFCKEHQVENMQKPNGHLRGWQTKCCSNDKTKVRQTTTVEEFIKLSKEKFGEKFGYDFIKEGYENKRSNIDLVCDKHGLISMVARNHLESSTGCSLCSVESTAQQNRVYLSKEEALERLKFDTKHTYILPTEKIHLSQEIIRVCNNCKGKKHVRYNDVIEHKQSCVYCSNLRMDTQKFIEKAKSIYGDEYEYDQVKYVNTDKKVTIICKKHGPFSKSPNNFLNQRQGCTKCSIPNKNLTEFEFVTKAKLIHGNNFDYDKLNYTRFQDKVSIHCNTCGGEFEQKPYRHLSGDGCKNCRRLLLTEFHRQNVLNLAAWETNEWLLSNTDDGKCLIETYKIAEMFNLSVHTVTQRLRKMNIKPNGSGSMFEDKVFEFITSITNITVVRNDRTVLNPLELDIYVPELNIAIECNGEFYHSSKFKPSNYHKIKYQLCEDKGIQLISIWETDWRDKTDIVKSIINNRLKGDHTRIFARKTTVGLVPSDITKEFLKENHLSGYSDSSINLGLYNDDLLVSIMTFAKPRFETVINDGDYEMIRFANLKGYSVIGGASKILKYFEKIFEPESLLSYADCDISNGDLYDRLGFDFVHHTTPSLWYIKADQRISRSKLQKHKLQKLFPDVYDESCTANDILAKKNIFSVRNTGNLKYMKVYQKEND